MRLALICDIHSNRVALNTVLADIDHQGVDAVVCGGDLATLGPEPAAVIDLLRERDIPCVQGNHDAFLVDPELIQTYTQAPTVVGAVDWSRTQLGPEHLAYLAGLPLSLEVPLSHGRELVVVHGSPLSFLHDILAETPAEEVDRMLAGRDQALVAAGHTHIQMLRQHRGRLIVNPGSVGMPFKEYAAGGPPSLLPQAEYALVESGPGSLTVSLKRLDLDFEALCRAVASDDNPLNPVLRGYYLRCQESARSG